MDLCGFFQPIQTKDDDTSTVSKPIPFNEDDDLISPFVKYQDGYKWPDLFTEIDECLETCVLVYPLADLRRMARANEVDNPNKILKLPLTHAKVMDFVEMNREKLTGTKFAEEFNLSILKAAEERHMIKFSTNEETATDAGEQNTFVRPKSLASTSIIAFDDEFENEELV